MIKLTKDKKYNILFIGNSYTYFNDMPTAFFEKGAISAGYDVTVQSITRGGYTLEGFADENDEEGARLLKEVDGKRYDCIIFQEHSIRPHKDKQNFLSNLKKLYTKLEAQTDRAVLYSTWGRKSGSDKLEELAITSRQMTDSLEAAYREGGELIGADVAYVGLAFADVYENHPEIEIYDPDLSHPSALGSFLASLVLLKTVFGIEPDDVNYELPFSESTVEILKKAAK